MALAAVTARCNMGGYISGGSGRGQGAGLAPAAPAAGGESGQARAAMTANGDSISSRGNVAPARDAANDMQEQCAVEACRNMNVTGAE